MILKESENECNLECSIFRDKFKDYLKILNSDEKNILLNYLKAYKIINNNKDAKKIINEIELENLKICKDNKELINYIIKYGDSFQILEICSENMDLENLSDNDSTNISKILKEKLKYCYEGQKMKIIIIYFNKIKRIEHFITFFKIFGLFKIKEPKTNIELITNKFWELFNPEQKNENIDIIIFTYILFLCIKNTYEAKNFIKKINQIDNYKLVVNIYEKILEYQGYLNDSQKEEIYAFYKNKGFKKEFINKNLKNTYMFLLKYFENKNIKLDYFYKDSKEISDIFKIFNYLNQKEDFKNEKFFIDSSKNFQQFYNNIENDVINFSQLTFLYNSINNPEFIEKIEYYKFSEREIEKLKENIKSKYHLIVEMNEKLVKCKNYLEKFPSTESPKLKNLINSRIRELEKQIKKFILDMAEKHFTEKLEKLYERALKYEKIITLKISSIFIFELENKVDKEIEKIKYLDNRINSMRKILFISSVKEVDKNIFNEFLALFGDEEELKIEINNLKKYFKIEENTSIIEKYLIYKFKYLKLNKTFSSIIQIINQFNLTQTAFYNKISELISGVTNLETNEENFEEEELDEKNSKINEYIDSYSKIEPKLELKLIPMDLISYVLNQFQENNLLNFLFELTINDLRDITNSLSGSSLDINDINEYLLIKAIIIELKIKSGIKDENEEDEKDEKKSLENTALEDIEFLKSIPTIISEKLNGKTKEEFKGILANCVKNQPKLLVLFENKKGFESSKEDIRSIISESTFEIYEEIANKPKNKIDAYLYESRYNCRCVYKEKTKELFFKELITLQQLASLSQNKEKEEENKILNIFIDLIENIKEIISTIEKIVYKGFPEEFLYRINIKNGTTTCIKNMNIEKNDERSLLEEKTTLKILLKKIDDLQKKEYREKKYLKFLYGQQLTVFNDYLNKKTNYKEVQNLIYYIIGNKFHKRPENFIYKTNLSFSTHFNIYNDLNQTNKTLLKPSIPKINEKKRINEESDIISTKTFDDTSSEISRLSFNNLKNKRQNETLKNNTLELYQKSISGPLMKKGDEKELLILMKDMYENIEQYLKQVMEINEITSENFPDNQENIFRNSIIREEYKDKKGFYIFGTGKNLYKFILKFYHYLVGNDPPRFSLLLCNEETTLEEFLSFLYLAIFCPYHCLFIIAKSDKLKLDIIYEVENILEKMSENEKDIKSYILFLFNDIGKSEIGKELLNKICKEASEPKKDNRVFNENEIITTSKIENKDYYKNIEIIKSSLAGYGKSHYITKKCKEEGLIYKSFPLGGEVKRKTIMRRLKELNIEKEKNKYGLHLDISDTKQKELFEDFLFSFLIQKVYTNNENIFCYEDNVKIYIEIQNGFIDLINKFPLLNEFNIHIIDELPKLELEDEESSFKDFEEIKSEEKKDEKLDNKKYLHESDIQIVCNYLINLNKIPKYNIFFYNLFDKSDEFLGYDYYINAKYINEKECRELLEKYFQKSNKSYHQINIYIKVLADQLRTFTKNQFLMIENLYCSIELGDERSISQIGAVRKDIIEAFLDLTNFFTIGAFDNILSEQSLIFNNIENSSFNEEEKIDEAHNKLSFEGKSNNFQELEDKGFVFINEDLQSMTIMTCAHKDSEIYKKLDNLYNSSARFGEEKDKHLDLPDFTKMEKNDEFLEIIKRIVNSKESVQAIKQKLGSYVFNADNFFKMVQILLRLRAGIPVLLMGETGCGKTSLINAIAEIKNYKIVVLSIHAGVNDNEIVRFMNENNLLEEEMNYDESEDDIERLNSLYNDEDASSVSLSNISNKIIENKVKLEKENENPEERQKIVFFDEFNTCNSLGLLTEIMCKKKCQGVNVKKNVMFAGACNPYRKIIKTKPKNGGNESSFLIKEESQISKQNLVYTVNPLNYTQLYYIFNFGSLTPETEKKYITGIVEAEVNDYVKDKNKLEEVKNLMVKSFTLAQSFIRDIQGKESVSMRETRKFMNIYKFLITDFENKKKLSIFYSKKSESEKANLKDDDYSFYLDKGEFLGHKYSIATSLYICFYIRLSHQKQKLDFSKIMSEIFELDFLSYPNRLQDELIFNIKLEKGIAPNESLKLNLLVCFIGILTRIAVFLVGPPGCSKTLCFNLLKKEMKGYHSKNKFWKQYPQLVVTSYQGSLTSTSKGIIDTFEDSKKKLNNYTNKKDSKKENKKKKKKKKKNI